MKYKLICMSFDGEYQTEHPEFDRIEDAWDYSDDLGSKWYFYPFHFVIKGKTIAAAGYGLEHLEGRRIKTVEKLFYWASRKEETQGMGRDEFAFAL